MRRSALTGLLPPATLARMFNTSSFVSLSDLFIFFSFSSKDTCNMIKSRHRPHDTPGQPAIGLILTKRCRVSSSTNFSGSLFDKVTSEVRSTGRDSRAASSCHLADSFTPLFDMSIVFVS